MNNKNLEEIRKQILNTVKDFITKEVKPIASKLDEEDSYPSSLIDQMAKMGLFGITIDE